MEGEGPMRPARYTCNDNIHERLRLHDVGLFVCFLRDRIRNPACKDPCTSQGLQGGVGPEEARPVVTSCFGGSVRRTSTSQDATILGAAMLYSSKYQSVRHVSMTRDEEQGRCKPLGARQRFSGFVLRLHGDVKPGQQLLYGCCPVWLSRGNACGCNSNVSWRQGYRMLSND